MGEVGGLGLTGDDREVGGLVLAVSLSLALEGKSKVIFSFLFLFCFCFLLSLNSFPTLRLPNRTSSFFSFKISLLF